MARACRRFGRTGSTVHAPCWWLCAATSTGRTEADRLVTPTEDECACAKVQSGSTAAAVEDDRSHAKATCGEVVDARHPRPGGVEDGVAIAAGSTATRAALTLMRSGSTGSVRCMATYAPTVT